ncbi:MAG: TetM/TetW/TetO/TetS family tetracycline resistance ribosomal protection protein, partial [Clostridia bacterium]|nr:TetM/TetW/TetO/TetS family tetracycline resistance ribosomal protection protein [Clostridia bacterium]
MKRLCIGILAHVDSGKTTLCEGLLYAAGEIRTLGRVDHKDAFLDTNEIERDRGITIFSKQAVINAFDTKISLLDTPGHVDFSAETERTLRVLDYAILVISGSEGVQSHTKTLWNLLSHYGVPTFIFINKMDLPETDRESILSELQTELSGGCIDFENIDYEQAATLDETLFEEYMESECLSEASIKNAISGRKIFPCFFGSALRNEGVDSFLGGVCKYTSEKKTKSEFGAKVFKISEDERGVRLTHIKVTSGSLKTKTVIGDNKINEMRIYSGVKFTHATEVFAGEVAAVTGLPESYPGMGLGCEADSGELTMEPVFTYSVVVPDGTDVHSVLTALRKIEQEETQMHVLYNELLQKIDVQIMGMIQLEVLKRILADRFSIDVEFEHGSIIYKETIANTVEGVGHYEPLRHYSEVHLLLEPGKRGSGLVFRSFCSEDVLDRNWQRLIMTHLKEKTHRGVLTGSPITDIRITLVNGRAHQKHTEGGDFRQSTYRAVRQGLMMAESVLLEPYYNFVLEVPFDKTGRAMTDLQ